MLKNDMPDPLLKRLVGHSKTMDTLGTYGQKVDGELVQAAGIMEKVYDRILG